MAEPIKVDFNDNKNGGGTTKEVLIPPDKAGLKTVINILITIVAGAIFYYFYLPPMSFRAIEFYIFWAAVAGIYVLANFVTSKALFRPEFIPYARKHSIVPIALAAALGLVLLVGYLTSCALFRANAFSKLLDVSDKNDINSSVTLIDSTADFENIAMIDSVASEKLADKVLGDLASLNLESQFDIATLYSTQINYKGAPCRVYPLKYGNVFKWLSNTSDGFPGYVIVNMNTQATQFFFLNKDSTEGYMKISPTEHFHKNLKRVVRFRHPTMIIGNISFEIDESGTPFWIVEDIKKRVGLISGDDVRGIVLVNAVTGEDTYYTTEEVKEGSSGDVSLTWIDQVYDANLLIRQYNYFGTYVNGFWNSLFTQTGVRKTTTGATYLAMGDDVYVYTGVTSVTSDQSILGFILINQRTKEALFYNSTGATELAAQGSAEGAVQDKGWKATFPLLINLGGEATYFMALKDDSNVVKSYAMVNVGNYNIVATDSAMGDPDLAQCIRNYQAVLRSGKKVTINIDTSAPVPETVDNNEPGEAVPEVDIKELTGVITDIRSQIENGNTCYYIAIEGFDTYLRLSASANPAVIFLDTGDEISVTYTDADVAELWIDAQLA